MPKKRHQSKYSKPRSTAPPSLDPSASLSLSSPSAARPNDDKSQTVNRLLANLRSNGSGTAQSSNNLVPQVGSLPPLIHRILRLPETTPPRPRRPRPLGPNGQPLPAGPPPPASWVAPLVANPDDDADAAPIVQLPRALRGADYDALWPRLPGARNPHPKSLVGMAVRAMTRTWRFQREYNSYWLHSLPGALRGALIATLSRHHPGGVTLADLKMLLTVPEFPPGYEGASIADDLNDDFHDLDLSGSIGRSISFKQLRTFLFPGLSAASAMGPYSSGAKILGGKGKSKAVLTNEDEIQDSWEDYESSLSSSPPRDLITAAHISHLALAMPPTNDILTGYAGGLWKHLLALADHMPGLTHLNVAYWPIPALSSYSGGGGGGGGVLPSMQTDLVDLELGPDTGSHIDTVQLAEAVIVLRRLSRKLYRLQYLDVTGCMFWWKALRYIGRLPESDESGTSTGPQDAPTAFSVPTAAPAAAFAHGDDARAGTSTGTAGPEPVSEGSEQQQRHVYDAVDWVGDWGKMETVVMRGGVFVQSLSPEATGTKELATLTMTINMAKEMERYVRAQRQGRGRWFSCEKDEMLPQ